MAFEGEYEFVPLNTVTYTDIPEAMKEFISQCGMMETLPRDSYSMDTDFESADEDLTGIKEYIDDYEDYDEFTGNRDERTLPYGEGEESMDYQINHVLRSMEKNNQGIFKFLEINGIAGDKARKFIKRVIRLSFKFQKK